MYNRYPDGYPRFTTQLDLFVWSYEQQTSSQISKFLNSILKYFSLKT